MKGPHAFPLTRLISIFHRIWASAPAEDELEDNLYGNLYGNLFSRSGVAVGSDPDLLNVDLATGFAGGRTGLEVRVLACCSFPRVPGRSRMAGGCDDGSERLIRALTPQHQ